MASKRVFLSALFLFLSGALCGAVLLHAGMRYRLLRSTMRPPAPQEAAMRYLQHELDLTPEQTQKLQPLLEQAHAKLETLRIENAPRVQGIIDEAAAAAKAELSPKQREKLLALAEMAKDHLSRMPGERRRPFRPPPPPF